MVSRDASRQDMCPACVSKIRIARNFGRSLRIPDASLQTSVNFPRTRPLKCMEQNAFLFNLNQEKTETKKPG